MPNSASSNSAISMHFLVVTDVQGFIDEAADIQLEVTVEDDGDSLTSAAAGKLLHVSCTHLNTLLDAGALGNINRTAGGHRRVSKAAIVAYKAQSEARQEKGLDAMALASQHLDLYGDELADIPRRTTR